VWRVDHKSFRMQTDFAGSRKVKQDNCLKIEASSKYSENFAEFNTSVVA
jgi:hypothetical protein